MSLTPMWQILEALDLEKSGELERYESWNGMSLRACKKRGLVDQGVRKIVTTWWSFYTERLPLSDYAVWEVRARREPEAQKASGPQAVAGARFAACWGGDILRNQLGCSPAERGEGSI